MRRFLRLRKVSKPILLLIGCLFCFAFFVLPVIWIGRAFHVDYSTLPKSRMFQWVWRRPIPADVMDIRIAGHGSLSGTVWMRIQASDPALKSLIGTSEPISTEEFMHWVPGDFWKDADAQAAGWDEIAAARKPRYYRFDATHESQGWYGAMLHDPERHVLYLVAGVL
jgi:hypothetical protein